MNGILSCLLSLPPRGAWIEILQNSLYASFCRVAPPTGSVDRNARRTDYSYISTRSLPPRGAWIEISAPGPARHDTPDVAPPTGSVDRNAMMNFIKQ